MPIHNELSPTSEQTIPDPLDDSLAMQDTLRENANSALRIFERDETPVDTHDTENTTVDTAKPQTNIRINKAGRRVITTVVAGGVAAATVATGVAVGEAVHDAHVEALLKAPTIEVTAYDGDGLQKLIEENVPQVASGAKDWRDVATDIGYLPQNSELNNPGHVLQVGETISIPVYESEK